MCLEVGYCGCTKSKLLWGHLKKIHVRYGPLSQKSAHAEQYAQTKTNTNPSPDPNRYRRRCPDPI